LLQPEIVACLAGTEPILVRRGAALRSGLPRVAAALRPGGWLIVGHGKSGGTPAQDALTRLKTLANGGTPIDDAAASQLLRQAGLTSVRPIPTRRGGSHHHRPDTGMTTPALPH